MRTSKYAQDAGSERDMGLSIGETYVAFTVEPLPTKKEDKKERLRLALGRARERGSESQFWHDSDNSRLEDQLTDILVQMLVAAETCYRDRLMREREWLIERKAEAAAELKRRKDEAERQARALAEKQVKERIARLLAQAKNLAHANEIRAYVETTLLRAADLAAARAEVDSWATWARQEADRIDPVKNGAVEAAVSAHTRRVERPVP